MSYTEVETGGAWKPKEVGEKLECTIDDRKKLPGRNNQEYTLFTVTDRDTGQEKKLSGAVLESKLNAEDGEGNLIIPNGSRVLITYKGKPKGTYLDYSVMVWSEEDKPAL